MTHSPEVPLWCHYFAENITIPTISPSSPGFPLFSFCKMVEIPTYPEKTIKETIKSAKETPVEKTLANLF